MERLIAGNITVELQAMVAFLGVSPLLGPNPTGLIGMSGLLIGAIILLWRLPSTLEI